RCKPCLKRGVTEDARCERIIKVRTSKASTHQVVGNRVTSERGIGSRWCNGRIALGMKFSQQRGFTRRIRANEAIGARGEVEGHSRFLSSSRRRSSSASLKPS